MSKSLVIAEKPSVARDLARMLGKFKHEKDFFENDQYVISSAIGHLVEMVPPEGAEVKRGKWNIENLPVLPNHFDLIPKEKTKSRLQVLKRLIKRPDVTEIINACDAGREGELIFRNTLRWAGAKKPTRRLWLQSMTPEAIRAGFEHLRSEQEMQPLADAATSRAESDWLVGINATRALTSFNSRSGGFQKTAAGRVQTPTLAILAGREEKIRSFKPRPYFEVHADLGVKAGSYRGRWFDEKFKSDGDEDARAERLWSREKADEIEAKCANKTGEITEEKKSATQASPLLYDLTTLQREANGRFSLSARRTLQIAQALYEKHKVLTYPRTDSRYLPEDNLGQVRKVMSSFNDQALATYAEKALRNEWIKPTKRVFNNAKVSDHHAIIPTGTSPAHLDDFERKIFDMVARRTIAVFYPAAQFEVTTRITRVEGEPFKTDGRIIVDPGWKAVYGKEAAGEDEQSIVPISPNERANVLAIEIKENETKPPARFNEATLLSAMEGEYAVIDAKCPNCGSGPIKEDYKTFRCQNCDWLMWKTMASRQFEPEEVRELLTKERVGPLQGFRSKMGRSFEAAVKLGEDKKPEFDFGADGNGAPQKIDTSRHESIGICPVCKEGQVYELENAYVCERAATATRKCTFRVSKTILQRPIPKEQAQKLMATGKTDLLPRFISKRGRPFSAHLKLENGKIGFEFAEKTSRTKKPRKAAAKL